MKQFILDGDIVKRLMFKEPIIIENYEINGVQWDFRNWTFNNEQPSDGITITKGKIIINKFKPNIPILTSNFTGTGENSTPSANELALLSKNIIIDISGFSNNTDVFNTNVLYNSLRNLVQSWHYPSFLGLWFCPYNTMANYPLPVYAPVTDQYGINGTIVYEDDTRVAVQDELTIRGQGLGASRYWRYEDKRDTVTPNWKSIPEPKKEKIPPGQDWGGNPVYYESMPNAYNQLGIVLYTSYSGDKLNNNGEIELTTPITISLINENIVDPTTQECFRYYKKNELLFERDKTIDNVYKIYNLLKENRSSQYKSQWQRNIEDGTPLGYNLEFDFDRNDYNYEKISIPVAIDLVQAITDEMPLKFSITQYDTNRNKFWETIVRTINQKTINDVVFCYHLFKNAKGLSELDWQTIGDSTLHGIVINLGSGYPYVMNQCFYRCDVPAVTINCQGTLNDLGDTFAYCDVKHVKIGQGIIIRILSGAFEATTKLESLEGLVVGNKQNLIRVDGRDRFLSCDTISLQYSFESTNLQILSLSGEDMVVYPYCPQMFGYYSYQTKLKTITGVAFDFKLVNPNDINNWGVGGGYGHPIFGKAIIESIQIKNLNKGNWTIPLPLDDTSVIYLLNNIYDLTSNDGEHLERDDNSFNYWSHDHTNQETHATVRFNHGYYAQISKANWNGRKIFKLQANVTTQISLMLKNQGAIVLNQQFNIATTETIIDRSANTFDEVRIGINLQNSQNDVVLRLSDPFDSAASTVTSATLTLSGVQYKADFDTAIAAAQAKGWTVNFAS